MKGRLLPMNRSPQEQCNWLVECIAQCCVQQVYVGAALAARRHITRALSMFDVHGAVHMQSANEHLLYCNGAQW